MVNKYKPKKKAGPSAQARLKASGARWNRTPIARDEQEAERPEVQFVQPHQAMDLQISASAVAGRHEIVEVPSQEALLPTHTASFSISSPAAASDEQVEGPEVRDVDMQISASCGVDPVGIVEVPNQEAPPLTHTFTMPISSRAEGELSTASLQEVPMDVSESTYITVTPSTFALPRSEATAAQDSECPINSGDPVSLYFAFLEKFCIYL